MKRYYIISIENLNTCEPKHVLALQLLSYLLRKHNKLPINQTRGNRLLGLLHSKKNIKRTVMFVLYNLGFRKSQIASMCATSYATVRNNIAAAESSCEIRRDFMIISEGITEVWM